MALFPTEVEYQNEIAEAQEHFQIVTIDKFEEIPSLLDQLGLLSEGGIFLTDSDETIRPSLEDKITFPKILMLDRVPKQSLNTLDELAENYWTCAVVSNQPRSGHQLAKITGFLFGYTPELVELQRRNIEFFGYEAKHKILGLDSIDFFSGIIRNKMYKQTQESADEIMEWIKTQDSKLEKNIVWVGNNENDTNFASMLKTRLEQENYQGQFLYIRLPNFYSQADRE